MTNTMLTQCISKFRLEAYSLALRHPWRFASRVITMRQGWIVRIQMANGAVALGDCAPLAELGTETPAQAYAWLNAQRSACQGRSPLEALHHLPAPTQAPPAARCALECALLSLCAQQHGRSVAQWLHPQAKSHIRINANLGSLDDAIATRLHEVLAQGFSVCKLKVGVYPLADEIERLYTLAAILPDGVTLRLDANQAWDFAQAQSVVQAMANLPIEALEEPLSAPDQAHLQALQAQSRFPLALDESLADPAHAQRLLDALPVQRLILKPSLLGGLLRCMDMAQHTRQQGLSCVVTSMLESGTGLYYGLHLAAAVDALHSTPLAHGLGTGDWFVTNPLSRYQHQDQITLPASEQGGCLTPFDAP
ncbi:o-succinylbenzoate synthase [Thiorhodospira sibirica]|uniref:o-succinylbenzoate synthase n=1 Tax=Thiorhodospira sibirica TaxID=154347 RepID=UPI00131EDE94|nr:o-succinylbenzoate synthase [Thiorhodospira sibirica]